jgi:hypothetical protein
MVEATAVRPRSRAPIPQKSPLETKRLLEEKHQHDICDKHECTTLFQDSLQ